MCYNTDSNKVITLLFFGIFSIRNAKHVNTVWKSLHPCAHCLPSPTLIYYTLFSRLHVKTYIQGYSTRVGVLLQIKDTVTNITHTFNTHTSTYQIALCSPNKQGDKGTRLDMKRITAKVLKHSSSIYEYTNVCELSFWRET